MDKDLNESKYLLTDKSSIKQIKVEFDSYRSVFTIETCYTYVASHESVVFTETINCRGDERLETLKDLFMSQDVANYIIAKNMLLYGK